MKYVWTLALLVLMSWTWSLANSQGSYDLETSTRTESEFGQLIIDSIKQSRPHVTSVNFSQLFTEMIVPGKEIHAHFRYQIEEPTSSGDITDQEVNGTSILISEDGGETWKVTETSIAHPTLEFNRGTPISPKLDPVGADDSAPPPSENPSQNK